MATNGTNTNFNQYADAWAQMMLTIWAEKMIQYGIHDTGALENSLKAKVTLDAKGNAAKIEHFYNYYGNYVARGVGTGYRKGNGGALPFTPKREKRPWMSGKYWHSKNKLLMEMLEQTGKNYLKSIAGALTKTNS
ncbi:hypothetical protein SAMD00024442_6_52 [Candidatus Symbiothrix dinenymphae]|nr:hypothetical protein SAMD00024442_6_52 [Candidatus Symbiothrix dinenymphae]